VRASKVTVDGGAGATRQLSNLVVREAGRLQSRQSSLPLRQASERIEGVERIPLRLRVEDIPVPQDLHVDMAHAAVSPVQSHGFSDGNGRQPGERRLRSRLAADQLEPRDRARVVDIRRRGIDPSSDTSVQCGVMASEEFALIAEQTSGRGHVEPPPSRGPAPRGACARTSAPKGATLEGQVQRGSAGLPLRPSRRSAIYASLTVAGAIPSPSFNELHLGPFGIHVYGLMYVLAVVAAILITSRRWERAGGDRALVREVALWGFPAGLVGGRLYHLATSWNEVPHHWWGPFAIWKGGLGIWTMAAWRDARIGA
jgi:hypothetical protein